MDAVHEIKPELVRKNTAHFADCPISRLGRTSIELPFQRATYPFFLKRGGSKILRTHINCVETSGLYEGCLQREGVGLVVLGYGMCRGVIIKENGWFVLCVETTSVEGNGG